MCGRRRLRICLLIYTRLFLTYIRICRGTVPRKRATVFICIDRYVSLFEIHLYLSWHSAEEDGCVCLF